MTGAMTALYGSICYIVFFGSFLYAVGFVGDFGVPRAIDTGAVGNTSLSLLIDIGLLGLFAVQHSVMARRAFKRWWIRIVAPPVERSTYVLFASLALALLLWQWRPLPTVIWNVANPVGAALLWAGFWIGWTVVLVSTFLISHFELFGLSQAFARVAGRPMPAPSFKMPLFYRWVRHPIYVGFLLAFWAAPVMTAGHLLFSIATTGYILIGISLEERDLIAQFGDQYRRYREDVGMLAPRWSPKALRPTPDTKGHHHRAANG